MSVQEMAGCKRGRGGHRPANFVEKGRGLSAGPAIATLACTSCGCTNHYCSDRVERSSENKVDGNKLPKVGRVSPSSAMARVLRDLYQGRRAWDHLNGRAMPGGTDRTERALRQRGLVTGVGRELVLTDAGRECAGALTS